MLSASELVSASIRSISFSIRERTSELAVLKAIGFSDRSILGFVLGESLAIALGGCVGLLFAMLVVPVIGRALAGMLPALLLSPANVIEGLIAAVLVGLASAILPGLGAMRLRVVDALRRV